MMTVKKPRKAQAKSVPKKLYVGGVDGYICEMAPCVSPKAVCEYLYSGIQYEEITVYELGPEVGTFRKGGWTKVG